MSIDSKKHVALESLDDYVSDTNPVRVVDVFVDELDLISLGFEPLGQFSVLNL